MKVTNSPVRVKVRVPVVCEQCGKLRLVMPYRSVQKYCSNACRAQGMYRTVEYTCQACGLKFGDKRSKRRKYCSKVCEGLGKKTLISDRFFACVQKTDTCWLWACYRDPHSYGRMSGEGHSATHLLAHRVSWQLHNGPIPEGMFVCHACDNPPCVNPAHLFLGTALDNSRDMIQKGRGVRGERAGSARFTAEQIRDMRERYSRGDISQGQLAREYRTSTGTMNAILRRKTWKHI